MALLRKDPAETIDIYEMIFIIKPLFKNKSHEQYLQPIMCGRTQPLLKEISTALTEELILNNFIQTEGIQLKVTEV